MGEANALSEIDKVTLGVTSQITRLECIRTLDRLLFRKLISAENFATSKKGFLKILSHIEIIMLSDPLLNLAESSFTVPVGSLDSIHLCSALLWQKEKNQTLTFFTHDKELSLAARTNGFEVLGG